MPVVVELRGGLGNQLFQYAAGYALSRRLDAELLLDVGLLPMESVEHAGVRRWPEQVSSFDHGARFIDTGGRGVRRRLRQARGTAERLIGDGRFSWMNGAGLYAAEAAEDPARVRDSARPLRINAYCNSAAYFTAYATEVGDRIRTVTDPSRWYLEERERILEERPVALHVRWGDYLNLKHVYGEIPAGYYRRAVDLARQLSGADQPVWLFSDDPEGASAHLSDDVVLDRVIHPDNTSTALENMLLMSGSSSLIAANSSFSWWAAALGTGRAGPVIFPRPLFGARGPVEPKDWLAADWIQIGRT